MDKDNRGLKNAYLAIVSVVSTTLMLVIAVGGAVA